jgi:hypothetical protein
MPLYNPVPVLVALKPMNFSNGTTPHFVKFDEPLLMSTLPPNFGAPVVVSTPRVILSRPLNYSLYPVNTLAMTERLRAVAIMMRQTHNISRRGHRHGRQLHLEEMGMEEFVNYFDPINQRRIRWIP